MASSSTISNQKSFKYHVFLSFSGEDTRMNFVSHLYAGLKGQGIDTFKDTEELVKGERIDELFKAIENSKFFVIVFSKKYASSSWCLRELAKIMECQKPIERKVYPFFYNVDPADVRQQSGDVGEAFARHKNEHVGKWKKALEDAGNLVGWDLRKRVEAEAIKEIVEDISRKLRSFHLSKDANLIGMEPRVKELLSSLDTNSGDVRMIGIKGMGGVGKTTLATAIFDKESFSFDGASFVADVGKATKPQDLMLLQEQVLLDVLSDEHMMRVRSVHHGKDIMKKKLSGKKVLLVLDNVDDADQLNALASARNWFKEGSRIIITTRDEKLLIEYGVNKNHIHDVNLLSEKEAISLFSWYAFKKDKPNQGYEKLSSEVVRYAAGLPLTIKTLGSHLYSEKKLVWKDAIKRLERIPWQKTLEVLKISYTGLEEERKEIFLDVACFMKGLLEEDAIRILESCGFHAIAGLRVLEQKSLITISNKRLGMHDSIEELGRNIVRGSHEPNKHSRLWIRQEIEALLSSDVVTETTTRIRLEQVQLSPEIIMKGLGNLKKLRVLILTEKEIGCPGSDWKFDQVNFPNALRFLSWEGYPVPSLPQMFRADTLVGLELPNSKITNLWESGDKKALENLRFLNLSFSKLRTLDLQMTPKLERLDLKGCHDLKKLDVPNGCDLKGLVYLDLTGCSRFKSLLFIKRLESLQILNLPKLEVTVEPLEEHTRYSRNNLPKLRFTCSYLEEQTDGHRSISLNLQPCTKLKSVSGNIFGLRHLTHVTFRGHLPDMPEDLDQFVYIQKLNLLCTDIKCLPDSICKLGHLKSLKLKSCLLLEKLPKDLGRLECLEKLSVLSTRITHIPDSICTLKRLKSLKLKSCSLLEKVPEDLGQLVCLEKLNLLSSRIRRLPDSIRMLIHLKSLELESCGLLEKLPVDLGQLGCLEKLILTRCASLEDIPNSICKMKRLRCFHLPLCTQVEKLPEELGSIESLKELNIKCTRISHLPQSISSLKGLRIVGSAEVLQSCAFATEIETSENETFCHIQAGNSTPAPTELMGQSTENYRKRNFTDHEATNTQGDANGHGTGQESSNPKILQVYSRRAKREIEESG